MRQIDLREYEKHAGLTLSVAERDTLRTALPLTIEPAIGNGAAYDVTPGSTIGAIEIGDLSVLIRPKIGIQTVLSLACYATGAFKPQEMKQFGFEQQEALPDALAIALTNAARKAFARGLLHGYRTVEETLHRVRGRIRFDEQVRRRFGIPVPIEVRYDEFTDDILANQLVKAAAARLSRMRLRSPRARRGLERVAGMFDNVSLVSFPLNATPEVVFDRLNQHYQSVVALARLILRHSAFEAGRGEVRATGFLMDMNLVFQEFITQALREALGVSDRVFRADSGVHGVTLDEAGRVRLKPDLSWWDGSICTFVGDAKYKRVIGERIPNADLYQLLAYATALDLPAGLLIYAKEQGEESSEKRPVEHRVRHAGKRLEIVELDLSGTLDEILARVDTLANRIRELRNEARRLRRAA